MYSVLFYSLSYLEISFNEICFPDIPEGRKRGINVKFQRKTQNKLQYVTDLVTKMQVKAGSQTGLRFPRTTNRKQLSNLQRQYPKPYPTSGGVTQSQTEQHLASR